MTGKPSSSSRYFKHALLAAVSACLAIVLASALWSRAKTHVLTCRLVPEQGAVSPQMIGGAARIVKARGKSLQRIYALKDWQVEIAPTDQLRIRFRTRSDPSEVLSWATMPGRSEFCLLHPDMEILEADPREQLPEGYHIRVYDERRYSLSRPGETVTYRHEYLVRKEPLMRVERFAGVHFSTVGLKKETVLTFEFDERQGREFRDLTALNVGRHMVLLVDGKLFFPPKQIPSAVSGGVVQVRGYFYNPPLRKLVKVLSAGTLPGRLEVLSRRVE